MSDTTIIDLYVRVKLLKDYFDGDIPDLVKVITEFILIGEQYSRIKENLILPNTIHNHDDIPILNKVSDILAYISKIIIEDHGYEYPGDSIYETLKLIKRDLGINNVLENNW